MRKGSRIALVATLAIIVGGLAWLAWRSHEPPEPTFKGKPLSFWLAGYNAGQYQLDHPKGPPPPTWQETDEALRGMGTNSLPPLLRKLRRHDSGFKLKVWSLLHRQSLFKIPFLEVSQDFAALQALENLGAAASHAVSDLIQIYENDHSAFAQQGVSAIISSIGPTARPAIPMLLRAITHTNEIVRNNAVYALGRIAADPKHVVPALVKCLNDPALKVRAQAIDALGHFGAQAQSAVPALVELLRREMTNPSSNSLPNFSTSVSSSWLTSAASIGSPGYPGPALSKVLRDALRSISPDAAGHSEAIQRGRSFLASLFDPDLQLLPEYRGANVYWLYHDNYLAAKVLAGSYPKIAQSIRAAIHREGVHKSGKIEIIFGETENPLPFRQYELLDIRKDSNKVIRTEVVSDRKLKGWEQYADLLLLASIAEAGRLEARKYWDAAMRMWDGNGFLDAAAKHDGLYSTYKLGLALLAANHFSRTPELPAGMLDKLRSLEDKSGGWVTGYDAAGKKIGLANVETTCLVILGLEACKTNMQLSAK